MLLVMAASDTMCGTFSGRHSVGFRIDGIQRVQKFCFFLIHSAYVDIDELLMRCLRRFHLKAVFYEKSFEKMLRVEEKMVLAFSKVWFSI